MRDLAAGSEDAFDAAVSALVMSVHEPELRALPTVDDPVVRREGWVWSPPCADANAEADGTIRSTTSPPRAG